MMTGGMDTRTVLVILYIPLRRQDDFFVNYHSDGMQGDPTGEQQVNGSHVGKERPR